MLRNNEFEQCVRLMLYKRLYKKHLINKPTYNQIQKERRKESEQQLSSEQS